MSFKQGRMIRLLLLAVLSMPILAGTSAARPQEIVAGGVQFDAPSDWIKAEEHSQMRIHQYEVPGEDSKNAELAVFYFGTGQGGDVDANIQRWQNQFGALKEGFTPEIKKADVNGLKVTTVHFEGTFQTHMGGETGPKDAYAMLGSIVEGPIGPVFFKLTGPETTVNQAKLGFDSLVQSFRAA